VKTSQYVRQEKAILAATTNDVRQRWLWGLRLLRDGEAMTDSGKSLKHGVTDQLIASAKSAGIQLSPTEIQRRLRCARAYQRDSQIRHAVTHFETWHDLVNANFPDFDAEPDEPLADHRTDDERKRDNARRLAETFGEQGSLFPLDQFEPTQATLKDLHDYAQQMAELTERFARRDLERLDYLRGLIAAAEDDMSMTWREAHERLTGDPLPT
jgi:hypothetical protein